MRWVVLARHVFMGGRSHFEGPRGPPPTAGEVASNPCPAAGEEVTRTARFLLPLGSASETVTPLRGGSFASHDPDSQKSARAGQRVLALIELYSRG